MFLPKTIIILKLLVFLVANVTAPEGEITEIEEADHTNPSEITEIEEADDTVPGTSRATIDKVEAYSNIPDPNQLPIEEAFFETMYGTIGPRRMNKSMKFFRFNNKKKAMLCQKCFERLNKEYQATYDNFYINPRWFNSEKPILSDVKPIKFSHPKLNKRPFPAPMMFQCYGRHKPIHTNLELDEYKDFIYIGNGPDDNSVIIYKHEKTRKKNWFTVIGIFYDIDLDKIEELELDDIDETEESKELSFNNREPLLESVYLTEFYGNCNLDSREFKKLSIDRLDYLCTLIFTHERHTKAGFHVDKQAYVQSKRKIEVELNRMVFKFYREDNIMVIQQRMVSCYGTSNHGQPLDDLKIAFGSRPNSVMVFKRDIIGGIQGYRPYQFVENLDQFDLK